ncbi:MAG: SH3 domain-containing protein [Chloroflexi bacterium]|nr:SH3 domain-containing protein [Chloroflexota bacterium]MCY4248237.1 SH3 domain-containing protein [Chloroflexota bacterium]
MMSNPVIHRRFGLKFLVLIMPFALAASLAYAADIRVAGDCGFSSAIKSANEDKARGGCAAGKGADTIILTRHVRPNGELPSIRSRIVIQGNNFEYRINKGDPAFEVKKNGALTITDLRMKYLRPRDRRAIRVKDGQLLIQNSRISNCEIGVEQIRSHTTLSGAWDICGLPDDQIIQGSHTATFRAAPPPQTCQNLPPNSATVTAPGGLSTGIQCQRLDARGVGNSAVIDAGLLDAVDIWGNVQPGVQVCFPRLGAVMFLDAATAPRALSRLDSTAVDNTVCVAIASAGTVALVHGQPTHAAPKPKPKPAQPAACTIVTTGNLVLRDRPSLSGARLGYVPRGAQATRLAQRANWHQVERQGQTGWLGGKYVAEVAGCD